MTCLRLLLDERIVNIDNKGSELILWIWHTIFKTLRFRKVSGVGVNLPVENDANLKVEVANYFNKNKLKSYLVDMGCESFFGCEVVLKNSKKAPNKIVLKVVDYKKKD